MTILAIFVVPYATGDCSKLRKNTFQCVSAVCKVTMFGFQYRKWVTERSITNFIPRALLSLLREIFNTSWFTGTHTLEKLYLWHSDRYVLCNIFDKGKQAMILVSTLFLLQTFPFKYNKNQLYTKWPTFCFRSLKKKGNNQQSGHRAILRSSYFWDWTIQGLEN